MGRRMGRSVRLLVRVSAVNLHCDHLDTAFLGARPLVRDVLGDDILYAGDAWDAAWADMLDCWCGCPL